jgi:hypothetical protein
MRTPLAADCTYLTELEALSLEAKRVPGAGCTNYKDERERITASPAFAVVLYD